MKHLFVPYELAVKLKENGFDEECLAIYCKVSWSKNLNNVELLPTSGSCSTEEYPEFMTITNIPIRVDEKEFGTLEKCSAPLYMQVMDWFDSKDIHVNIYFLPYNIPYIYGFNIIINSATRHYTGIPNKSETRYEAYDKAFMKALKLL